MGIIAFVVIFAAGVLVPLGVADLGPLRRLFHPIIGTPEGRPIPAWAHGGIAHIRLGPIPEGPGGPSFDRAAGGTFWSRPLSKIRQFIPDPLPAPLVQDPSCNGGGDLTVTFGDRTQVTYGPCQRPASINHLWAGMIFVLSHGSCAPKCGPGGAREP